MNSYHEIKTFYDQFQPTYQQAIDFKKFYEQISPLIEVYLTNKDSLEDLYKKLGYKFINFQESLGKSNGILTDHFYFTFSVDQTNIIFCHYKLNKYFYPNNICLRNNEMVSFFMIEFYDFLIKVINKLNLGDIVVKIEEFRSLMLGDNLIYACLIYKAIQFIVSNREFFKN